MSRRGGTKAGGSRGGGGRDESYQNSTLFTTENGDGEGGEGEEGAKRKSAPRPQKYELYVVAMDVGANAKLSLGADESFGGKKRANANEESDFERSKLVLDWFISRKLFMASPDKHSLVFFGHELTTDGDYPNIYVHNEEPEPARVEQLRMLDREVERPNAKIGGDYVNALVVALNVLKAHVDGLENPKLLLGSTVVLVSNLAGLERIEERQEMLEALAPGFEQLNARLNIVGVDFGALKGENAAQQLGMEFMRDLMAKGVPVRAFTFDEALSQMSAFAPKSVAPRGQPFKLELGPNHHIDLQMFVKNTEAKMELKFTPVGLLRPPPPTNGEEISGGGEGAGDADDQYQPLDKIRRYQFTDGGGVEQIHISDVDTKPDEYFAEEFPLGGLGGGQERPELVAKADLIKAYRYGMTDVPIPADLEAIFQYPEEGLGKQLRLLQFVKREYILPQFLISPCRYLVPKLGDRGALCATSALVQGMLAEGVVATCRYAYTRVTKPPCMACLIPKISKKHGGLPILMHFQMPFGDDFRYYDFPSLKVYGNDPANPTPTKVQLDVMDAYIDAMMLAPEEEKQGEGEEQMEEEEDTDKGGRQKPPVELFKKRLVHNPVLQYQCQTLKQKALEPDRPFRPLSDAQRARLLAAVTPPQELLERASREVDALVEAFPLERYKVRLAAFGRFEKKPEGVETEGEVTQKEEEQEKVGDGAEEEAFAALTKQEGEFGEGEDSGFFQNSGWFSVDDNLELVIPRKGQQLVYSRMAQEPSYSGR